MIYFALALAILLITAWWLGGCEHRYFTCHNPIDNDTPYRIHRCIKCGHTYSENIKL